jgi:hypothetical protein
MPISAELGPQLEAFVTRLVECGRYNSKGAMDYAAILFPSETAKKAR